MTKSYYGDQSSEAFYADGLYESKLRQEQSRRRPENDIKSAPQTVKKKSKPCQPRNRNNAALKTVSQNLTRKDEKAWSKRKGSSQGTDKNKKRVHNSYKNSWSIPKKPKVMPEPTVNIDPQEDMHLLLVEGSFPHGVDRHDYLSNVYYHGESSLLPSIGHCLDVLPPTKMTSGPWILVDPNEESLTLGDQQDWAGRRIRFASPKAATALSLQNVRVSPNVDILGSLTVAAFTGFCTHEEFHHHEQSLAQKALEANKTADWSKTVANLPPFQIDERLKCAGGFSVAVNFDPSLHFFYLKIGICEVLNEIVCVELVFPVRYKQIPNSASTIGLQLTERNLKRLEASGPFEDVSANKSTKRSKIEQGKTKSNASWKFDIDTFSLSSHRGRIFSPSQDFPTNKMDLESSVSQEPDAEGIGANSEALIDSICEREEIEASTKMAASYSPVNCPKAKKLASSGKFSELRSILFPECQKQAAQRLHGFKSDHEEKLSKRETKEVVTNSSPPFVDTFEEASAQEFFDAPCQLLSDDGIEVNPTDGQATMTTRKILFVAVLSTCMAIVVLLASYHVSPVSWVYSLPAFGSARSLCSMVRERVTSSFPWLFQSPTTWNRTDMISSSLFNGDLARSPTSAGAQVILGWLGHWADSISWHESHNSVQISSPMLKNITANIFDGEACCYEQELEPFYVATCPLMDMMAEAQPSGSSNTPSSQQQAVKNVRWRPRYVITSVFLVPTFEFIRRNEAAIDFIVRLGGFRPT